MDQNTAMVPKMRQFVKSIEGWYMKIRLYGALVHGWGLCYNLWIDVHYKHDSNQVVTSIMKALKNVYSTRGALLRIFYIQADNCTRKNKNKFLSGLCATLVGLGALKKCGFTSIWIHPL
jgi:hypothetical protein